MKKQISKKKVRNLRNVTMLLLVCVLMLSAATYAWFTMSDSASVNDISMNVASGKGGILFARLYKTGDNPVQKSDYTSVLSLNDVKPTTSAAIYYPATAKTLTDVKNAEDGLYTSPQAKALKIYYPQYDGLGSTVENALELTSSKNGENTYYYEATFYVKIPESAGATTQKVFLKPIDTLMSAAGADEITNEAVRVAFTVNDNGTTKTAVYEYQGTHKNDTGTCAGEAAALAAFGNYSTIIQDENGDFTISGTKNSELFELTVGQDIPMTIQIWFEGRDKQCNNVISGKGITGKFVFVTEDPYSSVTP